MKKYLGFLFGLTLLGLALTATAFEISDERRTKVITEIDQVFQQGPKIADAMALMNKADEAFLPDILVPVDIAKYPSMESSRILVGMYWMDMIYSAAFRQVEPTLQFGQAIIQLLAYLGLPWPEMERRHLEALDQRVQPGGEEEFWKSFREQDVNVKWQDMVKERAGLELLVDGLYGYLLEGIYLATEIAAQSNYDPAYVHYFSETKIALQAYGRLLALFADEPVLAAMFQQKERAQFIAVLLNIIDSMPEHGEDHVNAISAFVRKYRNDVIR